MQGCPKVVAAFGRKPLNYVMPNSPAATLEQPCFHCVQDKILCAL